MVINEIFLEVLDLVIIENHLGELAYAGVDTVHDLMCIDLFLKHGAAFENPLACIGMKFHLFCPWRATLTTSLTVSPEPVMINVSIDFRIN
jgi:hypothetical protein